MPCVDGSEFAFRQTLGTAWQWRLGADGSIVGIQGTLWAAHYSATKAYLQVFAEGLGRELRNEGVDVLAVAPGPTNTGFASRANMKNGKSMDPSKIASEILNSLGRKSTVLPGFLSKLLVYSMLPLPRWARIEIMGKVMRNMASTKLYERFADNANRLLAIQTGRLRRRVIVAPGQSCAA